MKVKTSELQGAALDWAVAQCECVNVRFGFDDNCPEYSTDWAQGGPIIERERIATSFISWNPNNRQLAIWEAEHYEYGKRSRIQGPTSLIAAMRCYVASKLGDEVEIPEELK
jgi:hypothetical protein